MADPLTIDNQWMREHPLPRPQPGSDKNTRGRVLVVGGSQRVPGGALLTVEAALRSGAGKVQLATIASAALMLGVAMPEIGIYPLAQDDHGEIACPQSHDALPIGLSDAVVIGVAMSRGEAAGKVLDAVLAGEHESAALLLDAAALMTLLPRAAKLAGRTHAAVLTPHVGEMAALLGCDAVDVRSDPAKCIQEAAGRYGAVVVLKGETSLIADRDGALFQYGGGGAGLATGGSGDVLAGIIAGLAARGVPPLDAALCGVWLHGEAGRRCAESIGPMGFLARELLREVPRLMAGLSLGDPVA